MKISEEAKIALLDCAAYLCYAIGILAFAFAYAASS